MGRARLDRRERSSRGLSSCSWRRALGAAVVLAFSVLAAALPPAAHAQTVTKLVANFEQGTTGGGSSLRNDHAQAFTTGSHAGGYKLTRVDFGFVDAATTKPTYTVKIYTNSSGRPGSVVGTLTNPANLSTSFATPSQFTAPAGGIDLAANTTYFVVVDVSNAGQGVVNVALESRDG